MQRSDFSSLEDRELLFAGNNLEAWNSHIDWDSGRCGHSCNPKEYLRHGDEFAVELLPAIGTLVTQFIDESS
jgi:hypothetical protein